MLADYPKPPFPKQKQPMPGRRRKGTAPIMAKKVTRARADLSAERRHHRRRQRHRPRRRDRLREGGGRHPDRYLSETTTPGSQDLSRKRVEGVLISGICRTRSIAEPSSQKAVDELGGIDILVNNAAHQATSRLSETSPTTSGSRPSRRTSPRCSI